MFQEATLGGFVLSGFRFGDDAQPTKDELRTYQ